MATTVNIQFDTDKACSNFVEWFRKEGFLLFEKSEKFNPLTVNGKANYHVVTCLATDEDLVTEHYFELQ